MPGEVTIAEILASLGRTHKYAATLYEPIVTWQKADGVVFSVSTDLVSYAPGGRGKIQVKAEGATAVDPKRIRWTVTGEDGVTILSEGGEVAFQVGRDVAKTELLVHVKITFEGEKGDVELDLAGVIVVSRE